MLAAAGLLLFVLGVVWLIARWLSRRISRKLVV